MYVLMYSHTYDDSEYLTERERGGGKVREIGGEGEREKARVGESLL